ncbi:MAG: hypothetical protein VR73_07570 [Gammaproteobacteria bacterium BRH_c0]|nr:MAG: hypothetical protein VR73_07570 [Gammaproteobacteria bacterium BRH_c0]
MSVRIGLSIPPFMTQAADDFWAYVDYCENAGVDSLWHYDRLISPEGSLEAMAVMAALAGRTRHLKFGMSALSVTFRDPLVLAKECATIDFLSGGRLLPIFGVGTRGALEWQGTGRNPATRGRLADEFLALFSRLLSEDNVSFEGEFFHYKDVTLNPKPVQKVLPLWTGGNSPAAIRRTARFATGWHGEFASPHKAGEIVAAIKAELLVAGRHIDDDHYGIGIPFRFGAMDDEPVQQFAAAIQGLGLADFDARQSVAVGDADAIAATLNRYVDNGICKFVAIPMANSGDDAMEQIRLLCETVKPRVER